MARIVVIGGIESTYKNAQVLHELGEEIVMFYTRGAHSPGWEGVGLVDEAGYSFADQVPRTVVNSHINEHVEQIAGLRPDFIYSLGWQQLYGRRLLDVCPVVGIHESLLPEGAGAVPIANAILHRRPRTGISLFWLDGGVDTGPLIGQLQGRLDPCAATSTELYQEAMELGGDLLRMYVPHINAGTAPRIPQDRSRRTVYQKIRWDSWPEDVVERARVYPYV